MVASLYGGKENSMFYDSTGEERTGESKRWFLDTILTSFRELSMPECLSLDLSLLEPKIIKVRVPHCHILLPTSHCWLSSLALSPMNTA